MILLYHQSKLNGQAETWTSFQSALFWCSPPYQSYNSRSFWRSSGYIRRSGQGQLVLLWGALMCLYNRVI